MSNVDVHPHWRSRHVDKQSCSLVGDLVFELGNAIKILASLASYPWVMIIGIILNSIRMLCQLLISEQENETVFK